MGPFESAGREPAAAKLQRAKDAVKARAGLVASRVAQAYHARTPVGRAEAANERGDSRFLIELSVDDHTMRTVESIEAIGWQFKSVDYVSTPMIGSGEGSESNGSSPTTGIYLFSRGPSIL